MDLKDFLYSVQKSKDEKTKAFLKIKDAENRRNMLDLRIICCLDVSGSISADDFRKFMLQIDRIKGMSKVRILSVDTDPVSFYDWEKATKSKIVALGGGGGTNFLSAMKMALKCKPDAILWLTDGNDSGDLSKPPLPCAVVLKGKRDSWYEWCEVCEHID